jgi:hypothetical protein
MVDYVCNQCSQARQEGCSSVKLLILSPELRAISSHLFPFFSCLISSTFRHIFHAHFAMYAFLLFLGMAELEWLG